VGLCVCVRVCVIYICVIIYVCVCMCVNLYVYVFMRERVCVCLCACVLCVCVCVYLNTYKESQVLQHMAQLLKDNDGVLPQRTYSPPRQRVPPLVIHDTKQLIRDGVFKPGWNMPTVRCVCVCVCVCVWCVCVCVCDRY